MFTPSFAVGRLLGWVRSLLGAKGSAEFRLSETLRSFVVLRRKSRRLRKARSLRYPSTRHAGMMPAPHSGRDGHATKLSPVPGEFGAFHFHVAHPEAHLLLTAYSYLIKLLLTRGGAQAMPSPFVDVLRSTNKSLTDYLDRLSCLELSPTAVQLQSLSDSIQQLGLAWTRSASPPNADQALEAEIALYAENLRRLKSALERLRPELEQRRAELHARLTKSEAALRWAATLKQTR
jgi:transposase InsO family protein